MCVPNHQGAEAQVPSRSERTSLPQGKKGNRMFMQRAQHCLHTICILQSLSRALVLEPVLQDTALSCCYMNMEHFPLSFCVSSIVSFPALLGYSLQHVSLSIILPFPRFFEGFCCLELRVPWNILWGHHAVDQYFVCTLC